MKSPMTVSKEISAKYDARYLKNILGDPKFFFRFLKQARGYLFMLEAWDEV